MQPPRPRVASLAVATLLSGGCGAGPAVSDAPAHPDPGETDVPEEPRRAEPLPPSHARVRRLAAREIRHALGDLTGVEVPADALPPDPRSDGFDNQASGALDALLVERLEALAGDVGRAVAERRLGVVAELDVSGFDDVHGCASEAADGSPVWLLWLTRPATGHFTVTEAGTHLVEVPARIRWAEGGRSTTFEVSVDGVSLGVTDAADVEHTRRYRFPVWLEPGEHALEIAFVGGFDREDQHPNETDFDYGLCYLADALALGPLRVLAPGADCQGSVGGCLTGVVTAFAEEAWRRPVTPDETARLGGVVSGALALTDDAAAAVASGIQAVVLSPNFLFVVDRTREDGGAHLLDDHALATRLSLFLWSSVPDDALRACADAGLLHTEDARCGLVAQVDRLVADPRFTRSVEAFAVQWLDLDVLGGRGELLAGAADPAGLLGDMEAETVGLVQAHIDADRPVLDLITADRSAPSGALAAWLGLTLDDDGTVDLAAAGRPGLVGQASVLVATSTSPHTSPVGRGLWVLDKLRCDPPDPPPPGVPSLPDERTDPEDVVDQLAQHRENPGCAGCHAVIDPVGLSLEGFASDGRVRPPLDLPLTLDDGTPMSTPGDLRAWLLSAPGTEACIAARLATFGVGEAVTPAAIEATGWSDLGWQGLVRALATSRALTERAEAQP